MPWSARPFEGQPVSSEAQQMAYYSHLGDGIINARTLEQGRLVADGTSVLRLKPLAVKMRGLTGSNDTEQTFNLATLTSPPPAGQARIDRLVIRLDKGAKTITAAVVTGVAAATPTAPALKWGEGDVWERELWSWRYTGVGLAQAALADKRAWLGPHLVLADDADLPATADIGSTADRRSLRWVFRPNTAGGVSWQADAEQVVEQYTAARAATTATFPGTTARGELVVGLNIAARPYRRALRADAGVLIVTRSGSTVDYDVGFRLFRVTVVNGAEQLTLLDDRTRKVRLGASPGGSLTDTWFLDPGTAYRLQWVGQTSTGTVNVTTDPAFTYMSAETRGAS